MEKAAEAFQSRWALTRGLRWARAAHPCRMVMIDELYGWRQAERAKVQQLSYAGLMARAERAKVTMMI